MYIVSARDGEISTYAHSINSRTVSSLEDNLKMASKVRNI